MAPDPAVLLDEIAELLPLADRSAERRVFTRIGITALRDELRRASRLAGVAHHGPHQLRHGRCSLWYASIRDAVGLIQWSGHAKPTVFLNTYAHVVVDWQADEWLDFWRAAYASRSPGVASVWPEEA